MIKQIIYYIVAGLVRVSTIMQYETGRSIDIQPARIAQFVQSEGIGFYKIFEEPGISGRKAQRKVIAELLRDARAGKFNLLVVTDVSRFFRNLEALLSTIRELKSYGVDFVSLDDGIDTRRKDNWGSDLVLVILGQLAEMYSTQLSKNTSLGKYKRFKMGLWNGSIPFGYCNGLCSECTHPNGENYCPNFGAPDVGDGINLVLHPIDTHAVKLSFIWYETRQYSDNNIARMLNEYELHLSDGSIRHFRLPIYRINEKDEKGVSLLENLPKEKRFRPFYKDFIRFLLVNPIYAGYVTYQHRIKAADGSILNLEVEWEVGTHPATVKLHLFDKVQRIRQEVGKNSRHAEVQRRIYPLSGGVLRCGVCQGRMRGNASNGGVRYYQCSNRGEGHRLPDGSSCTQEMVPAGLIEDQFTDVLRQVILPQNLWPDLLTHAFYQDDVEVIDYRRRNLLAEIERCKVLSKKGLISLDEMVKEVDLLREKISALTLSEHPVAPEAEALLQDLPTLWQVANSNQRKTLAHSMFRSVILSGNQITTYELRPFLTEKSA